MFCQSTRLVSFKNPARRAGMPFELANFFKLCGTTGVGLVYTLFYPHGPYGNLRIDAVWEDKPEP